MHYENILEVCISVLLLNTELSVLCYHFIATVPPLATLCKVNLDIGHFFSALFSCLQYN